MSNKPKKSGEISEGNATFSCTASALSSSLSSARGYTSSLPFHGPQLPLGLLSALFSSKF